MGQDTGKPAAQSQSAQTPSTQDQSAQDQPIQDQSNPGTSQAEQGPAEQGAHEASLLTAALDQSTADDLLHAAHVVPPETIANVELTLDHLSTTVDLFDVPPFDYGDTGGDTG
jgi:hypothetical protein